MNRLVIGLLTALLMSLPVIAQFARPPVIAPPPVVRPVVVPTPLHPQTQTLTPTRTSGMQPVRSSYKPALMAVLGGTLAVKTVPPAGSKNHLPAVANGEAFAAVAGAALRPPVTARAPVLAPPPAPQPEANDGPDWTGWVTLGGLGAVAAVGLGLAVALRPRGGRVRVVSVPPGEAPDWVRQAWVGVELPTRHKEPKAFTGFGVRTGRLDSADMGYEVDGAAAVRAVAAVDPAAAEWWRVNAPGVTANGYTLVFPADVCEQVG